jgi:hypothetical protein
MDMGHEPFLGINNVQAALLRAQKTWFSLHNYSSITQTGYRLFSDHQVFLQQKTPPHIGVFRNLRMILSSVSFWSLVKNKTAFLPEDRNAVVLLVQKIPVNG